MTTDDRHLFGDEQAYITWKRQQEAEAKTAARKLALSSRKLSPAEQERRDRYVKLARDIIRKDKARKAGERWRRAHPRSYEEWREWLRDHDWDAYKQFFIDGRTSVEMAFDAHMEKRIDQLQATFLQQQDLLEQRLRERQQELARAFREHVTKPLIAELLDGLTQ